MDFMSKIPKIRSFAIPTFQLVYYDISKFSGLYRYDPKNNYTFQQICYNLHKFNGLYYRFDTINKKKKLITFLHQVCFDLHKLNGLYGSDYLARISVLPRCSYNELY